MILTTSICHLNSENSDYKEDRKAQKKKRSDQTNTRIHKAKLANNLSVLTIRRYYSNKQKIPFRCVSIKDT